MNSSQNFPLLFRQIGHYLANASERPDELETARAAFNAIVKNLYGGDIVAVCPTQKTRTKAVG
jgi:hypothetical protein